MKISSAVSSIAAVGTLVCAGLGLFGVGWQAETSRQLAESADLARSLYQLRDLAESVPETQQSQATLALTDDTLAMLPASARRQGRAETTHLEPEQHTIEDRLEDITEQAYVGFTTADNRQDRALTLAIAQKLWKFSHTVFDPGSQLPDFVTGNSPETPCSAPAERVSAPDPVDSLADTVNAYLYTAQIYSARSDVDHYSASRTGAVATGLNRAEKWRNQIVTSISCTFHPAPVKASYSVDTSDPQESLEHLRAAVISHANTALADPALATDTALFNDLVELTFTADNINEG